MNADFERLKALAKKYLKYGKTSGTSVIELIAIGLQVEEQCRTYYNKAEKMISPQPPLNLR
jgi:hypothetical protein